MKCLICGEECTSKTCSGSCRAKLSRRTRTPEVSAHSDAHAPKKQITDVESRRREINARALSGVKELKIPRVPPAGVVKPDPNTTLWRGSDWYAEKFHRLCHWPLEELKKVMLWIPVWVENYEVAK